jgi:hypothetical protein
VRSNLSIVITPATYIDPAPKLKDDEIKIKKKYVEFINNIDITNFIEI